MKIADIKMQGSRIVEVTVADIPAEDKMEAMEAATEFVRDTYPQSRGKLNRWERLPHRRGVKEMLPGDVIHFF